MAKWLLCLFAFIASPVFATDYKGGVEVHGLDITISQAAHDHIAGDGLLKILDQAASEPAYNGLGDILGFRLFEIDAGSVFDIVGLKDGDVVTHIDDERLYSPQRAIDLLRYVCGEERFTYQVLRPSKWPIPAGELITFKKLRFAVTVK